MLWVGGHAAELALWLPHSSLPCCTWLAFVGGLKEKSAAQLQVGYPSFLHVAAALRP